MVFKLTFRFKTADFNKKNVELQYSKQYCFLCLTSERTTGTTSRAQNSRGSCPVWKVRYPPGCPLCRRRCFFLPVLINTLLFKVNDSAIIFCSTWNYFSVSFIYPQLSKTIFEAMIKKMITGMINSK